ncbi:MAG: ATP-dependent sacrificial sulfur transferase LarE [Nitrospirae bacterium]|nr:ATP-dependent sacrificial sulfur transferase LarE [Nitrospirota bacterium]
MNSLKEKYQRLVSVIKDLGPSVIAFSGGVDSTLVVKATLDSGIDYLAVTGVSPTTPRTDIEDVSKLVRELKLKHRFIRTDEHKKTEFIKNDGLRCYYCKDTLFSRLKEIATSEGYKNVLEGSNLDDLRDYRPGRKACSDHGVKSPLCEAGITKSQVRELLKMLGLWIWDKPSSPCLSSRIAYGVAITQEALSMVEKAEELMRRLGFRAFRVRHHGELARIEIAEEEMPRVFDPEVRRYIVDGLLDIGYKFVTLDLEGFISGKMNRLLNERKGLAI